MELASNPGEGDALHQLLSEATGDAVIRLDTAGFIQSSSAELVGLASNPADMLFKPHLIDLAHRDYRAAVSEFLDRSMTFGDAANTIKFPIGGASVEDEPRGGGVSGFAWHELALRRVVSGTGEVQGAVGLLRSIDHVRRLEGELVESVSTDELTGLGNARSFRAQLQRLLQSNAKATVILCEVEHFRALQLNFGDAIADDVIWAFSRFLRSMTDTEHGLARMACARFGIVMPDCPPLTARHWAKEVRTNLARLAMTDSAKSPVISANIGVARLRGSSEDSLRDAELALLMARAGNGVKVAPLRRH